MIGTFIGGRGPEKEMKRVYGHWIIFLHTLYENEADYSSFLQRLRNNTKFDEFLNSIWFVIEKFFIIDGQRNT